MNYLQQAKEALARQPQHLTHEQSFRLILVDAWLHEFDELLAHLAAKEPVYKPLSPMWQREPEVYWPDEINDPLRKAPPANEQYRGGFRPYA